MSSNPLTTIAPSTTPEQRTAQVLASNNTQTLLALIGGYNRGMSMIWKNPTGLTPQVALNTLGTNAAKQLQIAESTATFIASIATILGVTVGGQVPALSAAPTGYTLTANNDGTVTVTAPS